MPSASQAGFRPAAAAATTIVSDAAADDAGGTGARTIAVLGLDANFDYVSETVTMDGITPVACSIQFLRVIRMYVVTAGSGEVNAGNIDAKHGATVLCRIDAGEGQTLHCAVMVPSGHAAWIDRVYGEIEAQTGRVTFRLWADFGGVQRVQHIWTVDGAVQHSVAHTFPPITKGPYLPGTDLWIEATASSGTPTVNAGFDAKNTI
jgi:hypothetical protein